MENYPLTDTITINKMLDMLGKKAYDIETVFLEPTCGTGNFLIEILKRKLATANKLYKNDKNAYEVAVYKALNSIYGVDIIQDCIETTKKRLSDFVKSHFNEQLNDKYVNEILNRNIINQDILNYETNKYFDIIIGNPPY